MVDFLITLLIDPKLFPPLLEITINISVFPDSTCELRVMKTFCQWQATPGQNKVSFRNTSGPKYSLHPEISCNKKCLNYVERSSGLLSHTCQSMAMNHYWEKEIIEY